MPDLIAIFLMLMACAYFSGTETAILGLSSLNLVAGNKEKLLWIYKNREKLIASCLIGSNITIVAATIYLGILLINYDGYFINIFAFLIEISLFFFLAEALPKTIFRKLDIQILSRFFYIIIFTFRFFWSFSYQSIPFCFFCCEL